MNTRLSVLLARDAPVGVILRRGPSKQVLMIRWDLQRDTFEAGQWLKGRVYENHCDLSPRGDFLIYLAAQYLGKNHGTWTAISRPPYFTALALWPLDGTWQGGGGVFLSQTEVLLSHMETELAAGFSLPPWLKAGPEPRVDLTFKSALGPVFADRMPSAGWQLVQKGCAVGGGAIDPPEIWSKPSPKQPSSVSLGVRIHGYGEARNPRLYELIGESDAVSLSAADWADWCPSGDLLLARDSRIYRLASNGAGLVKELVDLSALTFEEREAPPEARQWEGPSPAGAPLTPSGLPVKEDLQAAALRLL